MPTREDFDAACAQAQGLRRAQMIAWQEELDWYCYGLYGVLPASGTIDAITYASPPEVALGERALKSPLRDGLHKAGSKRGGLVARHPPMVEIPNHWPQEYRRVVERRIELIESDRNIGLVESMNCKRRWEGLSWADHERNALRDWLLDRLESPRFWRADGTIRRSSLRPTV